MQTVQLLDTTLRDGMYITDFYTDDAIKGKIIKGLETANVDIIECGFLEKGEPTQNSAMYRHIKDISPFIAPKKSGMLYAGIVMHYDGVVDIPQWDENMIDCIRLAFFKHDIDNALRTAEMVRERGFRVMIQPSRTGDYSNVELRELIRRINTLRPYSVAVVDTFGNMPTHRALELLSLYHAQLDERIRINFHFHNNYQLAFANAIAVLTALPPGRELILDASVFGMGRGAGNLCMEMIMDYLNNEKQGNYNTGAVFDLYKEYIEAIYRATPWGYSLMHYISAKHNCNPYYATYFSKKYNMDERTMDRVMAGMAADQKVNFYKGIADTLAQGAGLK
jgi:4-hydroxy 2-oxovalerate aldolase